MQIFSGQQWQLLSDLHHFLFAKFIYKDDNWLLMLFEHTSCWIVSLCVFVCLCVWLYFCGFWSEPRTRQSVKEIKKRRKSVAWPELFIVFKMVQHTEVWRPIQYMHMCVCLSLCVHGGSTMWRVRNALYWSRKSFNLLRNIERVMCRFTFAHRESQHRLSKVAFVNAYTHSLTHWLSHTHTH